MEEEEVAYHSQDFDWNELREEIEASQNLVVGQEIIRKTLSCNGAVWEKFHRRHSQGIFFKERRYLLKEFPELSTTSKDFVLLEIGCGAGSSIIPILRANKNAKVYACDVSETALSITETMAGKIHNARATPRLCTFLCDPSKEALPTWLACSNCRSSNFNCNPFAISCCEQGVGFTTLIFTLSALQLNEMESLIKECYAVLRPGGMLFFRDYGLYDMTMLRFPPEQRVADHCYQRLDGTLSYFFTCETVRRLFTSAGFLEMELQYCCVKLFNRKKQFPMRRVWVHAKFMKERL